MHSTFHITFRASGGGRCLLNTPPLSKHDAKKGVKALKRFSLAAQFRRVEDGERVAPAFEARPWNESEGEA